jgi:hypothetical protein
MGSPYVPQVLNVLPNMFSIAPHFYPIWFGKCCPPFTYIRWAKWEELGSLPVDNTNLEDAFQGEWESSAQGSTFKYKGKH